MADDPLDAIRATVDAAAWPTCRYCERAHEPVTERRQSIIDAYLYDPERKLAAVALIGSGHRIVEARLADDMIQVFLCCLHEALISEVERQERKRGS